MANSTASGVKVEVEDILEPKMTMGTGATTIKEEIFNDVIQWRDVKVKEEEQSEEMENVDQVKIFLVEPNVEMSEARASDRSERADVKDPLCITGEIGGEDEEGKGEDLKKGVARIKVVQARPVKRKPRGKKTKVNYNKDLIDEDIDDPDHPENDGLDTCEEEGPPAKAPRRSSRSTRTPGPRPARSPGRPKSPGARTRNFKCDEPVCAYEAHDMQHLEDHRRGKHGATKLECTQPDCTKEFGSTTGLRRHKRSEHQGLCFKCSKPGCDFTAPQKRDLGNHDRAKHSAPKLECPEADCDMQFGSFDGLRMHKKVTHMEILIQCTKPGCHYTAGQLGQLQDHNRAKHGAPKLECTDCCLQFSSRDGLRQHKRATHTVGLKEIVFKCPKPGCPYKAMGWPAVQAHKRAKHGYQKLTCKEPGCGKEFVHSTQLSQHKKKHMG